MTWTTPATWTAGQVVSASDMNAQVRDNENYLLSGRTVGTKTAALSGTTTSTTFVDIDATNAIITQTVTSSRVLCICMIAIQPALTQTLYLDIIFDSTTRSSGSGTSGVGLWNSGTNGSASVPALYCLIGYFSGLSIASHTFKPQWRTSGGTQTVQGQHTMWLLEV